jgi:hypothetical protein
MSPRSNLSPRPNRIRRVLVTTGLVAGASLGAAGVATAATGATTTASSSASSSGSGSPPSPPSGNAADPATMTHGPGETLLTGSDLEKATAAATTAVPGATVIRAETNSSGSYPYEVHMKKSDGTDVTVELNSDFGVITTISGFGGGPTNGQVPNGHAPDGSTPSTSTQSASRS